MTTTAAFLLLLVASLAVAAASFTGIVRRYRQPGGGFPWLFSLGFAAASIAALAALRALFGA